MPPTLLRRLLPCLLLAAVFAALPLRSAAELVWNPDTGWQIQGGVLSGLNGPEGLRALDLMNTARRAEDRGSYSKAIKDYNRVIKKYGNSIYTPEALYRSARLYEARDQYSKAFNAYTAIIGRYPNTDRFDEIIGRQYQIASALLEGKREKLWGWLPGMMDRPRGIAYFEMIVAEAPYNRYSQLALMAAARGQQRLRHREAAIDALDRLINKYPNTLLAPDAYLLTAELRGDLVEGPAYDQTPTKDAITYYRDFMILYPGDPSVAEAQGGLEKMETELARSKILIGDFYFHKRDNFTAARVFYNEAITVFPDSDIAKLAHQRLEAVAAKEAAQRPSPEGKPAKKKRFLFF